MALPRSLLATTLRLGLGARTVALGPRPSETLVLYDFEACPYCRKVREVVSMLDLVVDIRPCPKQGRRFRAELETLAPRVRLPTLVDPAAASSERVLQESDAIVEHLFARYGSGAVPRRARLGVVGTWTSGIVSGTRPGRGRSARPSKPAAGRYELYAFEASDEARVVREVLTELEIPYRLLPTAVGSERRREFGHVPRLRDVGRRLELVGAHSIVAHLEAEHAA